MEAIFGADLMEKTQPYEMTLHPVASDAGQKLVI
jgi:hypothetical protein